MNDSEVKQVISFIYKRSGEKKLKESDIYLTLSMELNWCPPHIAKSFVSEIEKTNLIARENNYLLPTFNIEKIQIPIDFRPSIEFFKNYKAESNRKSDHKSDKIIYLIQEKSNLSDEEIKSNIAKIQKQKLINTTVAKLLLAKQYDIDIESYIHQVEKEITIKNKE